MSTSIVAAGKEFDIGCQVVRWNEPGGLAFYPYKTFNHRTSTYEQLQQEIKCFVLHHSVTYRAIHTYHGLIARGLSVNFIIDDDNVNGYATIYQCLDIQDGGWSHKPLNNQGPGVEISYRPEAWSDPNLYNHDNRVKYSVPEHQIVSDTVHGMTRKVFAPTDAQVKACTALLWGFCELFPQVRRSFPRQDSGELAKSVVSNPEGLLSHYNLTTEKIDPAGFPHQEVEAELAARLQLGY
jgi:hypothetical protein